MNDSQTNLRDDLSKRSRDELNIIAKRLRIARYRRMTKENLIHELVKTDATSLRRHLKVSWWDVHHNHVYGTATVVGLGLTILFFVVQHQVASSTTTTVSGNGPHIEFVNVDVKESLAFPLLDVTLRNPTGQPAVVTALELEVVEELPAKVWIYFKGLPSSHVYDILLTPRPTEQVHVRNVSHVIPANGVDRFQILVADPGYTEIYTEYVVKLRVRHGPDAATVVYDKPLRFRIYHLLNVATIKRPRGLSLADRIRDLESHRTVVVRDAAFVLGLIDLNEANEASDASEALGRVFSVAPRVYEYDKGRDDILKSRFNPQYCSYNSKYPYLGEMYMAALIALMRIAGHTDMTNVILDLPDEYRSLGLHSWRRALAFVGEMALPDLTATLDDNDEWTRYWAVDSLRHIGHPDAVPALVDALQDESQSVRAKAADALRELGAIEELRSAKTDESVSALQRLQDDDGSELLKMFNESLGWKHDIREEEK